MTVRQKFLSESDFQKILERFNGRKVEHVSRAKILDSSSGRETFRENSTKTIFCYFNSASRTKRGDAVLMAKYSDSVKKDDLIIADGVKYVVRDVNNVPGEYNHDGSVNYVYSMCNLTIYHYEGI